MTRYIIRRLLQAIPTLIGISIISFILVNAAPGDPITMRTFNDPRMTEATRQILRRQLGLDQPLPLQYLNWFAGVALRPGNETELMSQRGAHCAFLSAVNWTACDTGGGVIRLDLGTSLDTKEPVWQRMKERMGATIELGLTSLLLSLFIGVPLGVLSAVRRGTFFDNSVRFSAAIFRAVPIFWTGLLAILLFSVVLGWLPSGGRQTISITGKSSLLDDIQHLILPASVLAIGGIAGFSRIMRTETLEVLHTDYIRTAQAKGLAPGSVWFVHAFRNALIPLMTILGPAIVGILSGAVVVETIFAWPGMGRLTVAAAFQQDYPLVLGAGMFFAVLTIVGNLLSDIFYGLVDPRVRLE